MTKTIYVGIDVSKGKFDTSFTIDGNHFISCSVLPNNEDGFKKLLSIIQKQNKLLKADKIHFCLEATGIYHFNLTEFLQESNDNIVSVINPLKTKSFGKSLLLRTKNDKVDAEMIAFYGYMHKPKHTPQESKIVKKFRSLVRYQDSLIVSRTQEIARLKSCIDSTIEPFIKEKICFIENQIQEIKLQIENLIREDEFLQKQVDLLKSIDGIGNKVAWKLLSEIKFSEIENISPKSQVAHAGLSPREFQSGSSVKGRGHICRMGNSSIRKVLFMPVLSCIKNQNYFYDFYHRLLSNGKPKKVAITATMRKMLVTASGVLKNQQPFDPDWAQKKQEEYLKTA